MALLVEISNINSYFFMMGGTHNKTLGEHIQIIINTLLAQFIPSNVYMHVLILQGCVTHSELK